MKQYLKKFKSLDIKTKKHISSAFLGNFKSAFKGNGLTFSDFKLREEGEDTTRIDWLVSAREGKILLRKMEEERELSLLFILDLHKGMDFGFEKTKKEILFELLFLLSLSAIEDGDRIGGFLFGGEKISFFPFSKKREAVFELFYRVESYYYDYTSTGPTYKQVFEMIENLKIKRNLVFILTDKTDIEDKYLKTLCFKNEVIFVNIFHSFENTLDVESIGDISITGLTQEFLNIDITHRESKDVFKQLRTKKLAEFAKKVRSFGGDYILLDENTDVFKSFFTFMQKRLTHLTGTYK